MDSNTGRPSCLWLLFLAIATCFIPAGLSLIEAEFSVAVFGLSALALSFELGLCSCCSTAGKGKQLFRQARLLPLRLGLLYAAQLLMVIPQITAVDQSSKVAVPPARPGLRHSARSKVQKPADARADAADAPANGTTLGGASNEEMMKAVGFQLDASRESLRWSPKTISVVLPCAEEREYALKTVQAVFANTPPDVLHEIVVVDDGSQPPLSTTHLTPDVQKQYLVKIKRHSSTVGLIGAKKTGGDAATGDIIVFFDCHVAPQPNWDKDFLDLISENYRRMVVPQITALNVDTWTQQGAGGGMSKCYVTWDGDFKWGGPNDMYMGMLSGGLAGMSRRWWWESGGFDDQMMGWGGENIDQGVRMWVCGGEIVAAPHAQVAHMWRTGDFKTRARYRHVGDTIRNRARAVNAWFGEFAVKLDDFPSFASRKRWSSEGETWYGDMSTFQRVKDRLQGCRPFAWYLRRFKAVYEDGGIIPEDIFMIKEKSSNKCLRFMGSAGTSGSGHEQVTLANCQEKDDRFFWHLGNADTRTQRCCSGFRAWNTEQCLQGDNTGICEVTGKNGMQHWHLTSGGELKRGRGDTCLGVARQRLVQKPCAEVRKTGVQFSKEAVRVPIETQLYRKAQAEHPEAFKLLNAQLEAMQSVASIPKACREKGCVILRYADGGGRCISETGELTSEQGECVPMALSGDQLKNADTGQCLDSWSDRDPETFGFYGCHGGPNQLFDKKGAELCTRLEPRACFQSRPWSLKSR